MPILSIHIILAFITLGATAAVAVAAYQQKPAKSFLVPAMWTSFMGVAVSGIGLVVMSPQSVGHACAVMTAFVVMSAAAQVYYNRYARQV